MSKRIELPFVSRPMIRMILRVDESHEQDGVTVIDKAEIEEIFVVSRLSEVKSHE